MKQIIFTAILILTFCFAIFAQANEICPKIAIVGPPSPPEVNEIVNFTLVIGDEAKNYEIDYIWTAKGGKIVEGQGTKVIKVLMDYVEPNNFTVEIKGLPSNCPNSFSESMAVNHVSPAKSRVVDKFGILTSGEKKARLDYFFNELKNNLYQEGVIQVKDNKNLKKDLIWMIWYMSARGFDRTRISFEILPEFGQEISFLLIPPTGNVPECKECLVIKAEDFERLEKLFQPKLITKNRKK